MLQIAIEAICCGILAYAALRDVVTRTVPNSVSLILVAFGIIRGISANTLLLSTVIAGMVLSVAILLWRMRLFGGGDVKLLASACLLVSPQEVPGLLASIALIGGVLACFYIVARNVRPLPSRQHRLSLFYRIARAELWRINRRGSLPYAFAIAFGTITQLVRH